MTYSVCNRFFAIAYQALKLQITHQVQIASHTNPSTIISGCHLFQTLQLAESVGFRNLG